MEFCSDEWRERLSGIGITSLEDALDFGQGNVLSRKSHSRTVRYVFEDGQACFIKTDYSTRIRAALRALIHFSLPVPATQKERLKMERMGKLGFCVAATVAYGSSYRFLFPHQAVLVTLPVAGRPVDAIWEDGTISQERRERVRDLALSTLERMQRLGCDWGNDCKPEHFFVTEEGKVSIIDVERMKFKCRPLPPDYCLAQRKRFLSLLKTEQ